MYNIFGTLGGRKSALIMSNSIFSTIEGRKSAFMMLYKKQKYDIVEIANELDIQVGTSQTMPDDILGFIRYKKNKFEIVVDNKEKIKKLTTNGRIQTTIAYEVAHWIYDYDEILRGNTFVTSTNDALDSPIESRASMVAHNIVMNINNPLV